MPEPVVKYGVYISSPTDVLEERQAAREVIEEWNGLHSDEKSILFEPLMWEDAGRLRRTSHHKELLHKADILVAIFWTRIGTPTGQFPGATVEAIETFKGLKKWIYFSDRPFDPDPRDPDQFSQVKKYRKEYKGLSGKFSDVQEFRKKFMGDLSRFAFASESVQLAKELRPTSDPIAQTPTPDSIAQIGVPRFSSDDAGPGADDLIGVEWEAHAFARYIAAKNIDPPLSIALFGDWGSGKTFLMNKIQKHVDLLAARSAIAQEEGEETAYCERIVQIEFNAWYYMETNLWASLVEHIFNSLDAWLRSQEDSTEQTIDALFKQLDAAWEAEKESQAELEGAEAAKTQASQDLRRIRKQYERAVTRQHKLTMANMWEAVTAAFEEQLQTDKKLQEDLKDVQEKLGLSHLTDSAEELHRVLTDAKTAPGRSRLILSSIFSRQRPGWSYASLVVLMIFVPLGTSLVLNQLPEGLLTDLGSGIAEVSALLATISGWIGVAASKANAALDKLNLADQRLQKVLSQKLPEHQEKVAGAENLVAGLVNRVKLTEQRLSEAQQNVAEVKQSIRAETVRGRLNAFIRERAAQEDYAKHLGLISLVRRDFQKLSDLMLDGRLQPDEAERLPEGIRIDDLRSFERVVLYIDDLDRCSPDKVVDVLQAIHLLLAFKLFVVVVGVDPRWVSRSLKYHYPLLLSENVAFDLERTSRDDRVSTGTPWSASVDDAGSENIGGAQDTHNLAPPVSELSASSHDYLEKIFQVPYWIRPMDEVASKEFIRQLASQDRLMEEPDEGKQTEMRGTTEVRTITESEQDPAKRKELEKTEADKLRQTKELIEVSVNPKQMSLTQYEIDFMEMLAPFVGKSPRRSKRFVNIYRLIKAGLTLGEHAGFVGDEGESLDYRAVLAQLAIVTGAPISAPTYFAELIDAVDRRRVTKLTSLLKNLRSNAALKASVEWPHIEGALKTLQEAGRDIETFRRMRYWTRRVMRYSFTTRP